VDRQEYLQRILTQFETVLRSDGFKTADRDLAGDSLMAQFEETFEPDAVDSVDHLISIAFGIEQIAIRLWTADHDGTDYLPQAREAFETAAKLFERLAEAEEIPNGRVHLDLYLHCAADFSLGELQANSAVLARKVLERFQFDTDMHSKVLRSTFLLLRRDVANLQTELSDLAATTAALEDAIRGSATSGALDQAWSYEEIAHLTTLEALLSFARYLCTGQDERYEVARRKVESALQIFDSTRDPDNFVLTQLILLLIRQMHHCSLWHQLGELHGFRSNAILARYLKVLTTDRRPIHELWRSQMEALPEVLGDSEAIVLQMPTSAGKTRVAELKIAHTLATSSEPVRCVYVAPFKSLAAQVQESLEYYLGKLGYRVASLYGSYESVDFEDSLLEQSEVLVVTPEKLDYLFRQNRGFFDSVRLIVLDEGHILDNDARGLRLEMLLHRLRKSLSQSRLQVLFISAVVPNAEEIGAWLSHGEPAVVESRWRPTKLRQGIFYWGPDWEGRILYRDERFEFITGLRRRMVREYRKDRPTERLKKPQWYPQSTYDIAIELALELLRAGPTILFTAVRTHVDSIALKLNGRIDAITNRDANFHLAPGHSDELEALARRVEHRLGQGFPLADYVRKGFAYHHGQLPDDLRSAIEEAFRAEHIPILIATPTLAHGVNLPVHLMIVANLKRGPDPFLVRDFRNIAGRAGRALHETEGHVIFIQNTQSEYRVQSADPHLRDEGMERVRSALFKLYEQLVERRLGLSLAEFLASAQVLTFQEEDLRGVGELDKVFQTQILALLYEGLLDETDPSTVEDALSELFFGVQCARERVYYAPMVEYAKQQVRYITASFQSGLQKSAFYRTGLSLASCLALEEEIRHLAGEGLFATMRETPTGLLNPRAVKRVLELVDIPYETRSKHQGPADLAATALMWINYADITDLVDRFGDDDSKFRNKLYVSDLVYRHFMNNMPWALNSVVKILVYLRDQEDLQFDQEIVLLPSYAKYGVNTPVAAYVSGLGVAARGVSRAIADYYYREVSSILLQPVAAFHEWVKAVGFEDLLLAVGDPAHVQDAMRVLRRYKLDTRPVDHFADPTSIDFKTYVMGLGYDNRLAYLPHLAVGDEMHLVREPDNAFDPYAMAVCTRSGDKIGYLRMALAFVLSILTDEGWRFDCHVERLYHPPRHPNRRLLIHIPAPSPS